jgi:uncharacterized protein YbjQ (UPF0145 family)
MRNRILCAVLVSLMTVTGAGCHHMRAAQYAGSSYEPPPAAPDTDGDHDHDHEEGPITPELQAAADHVLVLQGSADRACEVLGLIDEHGHMGQEDVALARLRRDAARMGGDAIVHVEFHHAGEHHDDGDADHEEGGAVAQADHDVDGAVDEDAGDPLALHLSGTVVRFRDLVAGRHYEVIRRLVAHPPMQHEEEGLDDLRRQARALHADLLLDVEFHHGHGEDGLEVDGTAIRFVQ